MICRRQNTRLGQKEQLIREMKPHSSRVVSESANHDLCACQFSQIGSHLQAHFAVGQSMPSHNNCISHV